MTTYLEKLRDPRWQKKRLEIFERDNWECKGCSCNKCELQIHHLKYLKDLEPWEYENEFLQTLCINCHKLLKDTFPGSVILIGNGFSYDGFCPKCRSSNIKEKGSWDKCLDCGFRISFYPEGC